MRPPHASTYTLISTVHVSHLSTAHKNPYPICSLVNPWLLLLNFNLQLQSLISSKTHTFSPFDSSTMSMNTAISSSSRVLLKKPDVDLDSVPKNTIGSVKIPCFSSSPSSVLSLMSKVRRGAVHCASMVEEKTPVLSSGVLFQPFEEVKKEEFLVPISPQTSLARQNYFDDCEAAINEQIK